jgi:hypothetical protein
VGQSSEAPSVVAIAACEEWFSGVDMKSGNWSRGGESSQKELLSGNIMTEISLCQTEKCNK